MKKSRHEAIIKMIENEAISTQEDLMIKLRAAGYNVTQATVSRDIKTLGLVKTPVGNGIYRYSVVKEKSDSFNDKYLAVLKSSVSSIDSAGNIVAIKCFAGMASAAAAAIDNMNSPEIVATLAGDDTIFVLCKDEESASEYKKFALQYID